MLACPIFNSQSKYQAKTYMGRVCISIIWLQHWATETETEHCENIHVSFHAAFIFCMFSTIWTRQYMSFWSLQNLNKWTKSHVLPHGTLINKLEQNLYFQLLARRWKLKHCKNCEICPSQVFWKKKFHVNCGRYECRYKAFRAAKNAKLTNISNTKLGTVDLRTRKETESRAECLEFVESFNKTLNNPK